MKTIRVELVFLIAILFVGIAANTNPVYGYGQDSLLYPTGYPDPYPTGYPDPYPTSYPSPYPTPATPPKAPILLVPKNNALIADYTPLLVWKNIIMPPGTVFDYYEIEIDNDSTFIDPEAYEYSYVNQIELALELDPNTKYYWRVRTFNTIGQYSNWSKVLYFRTALLPPTLVLPVDAFTSLELRPPFDWDNVTGATGYTIQISKNSVFTQIVHTGNPVASNFVPTVNLPQNAPLFWRVQSKGANGPSDWSEVRSFTTPVESPPAPSLLLPKNNTLATDYTPTFTWTLVVLPTGMDFQNYMIQVDDDPQFGSPEVDDASITDISTAQFMPGSDLDFNTKYYWRVRAVNTDGELSNWSKVLYFRTALLPPTLVSPVDGFASLELRPLFDWGDDANANGYNIQISTTPDFKKTILNGRAKTSSYTPTKDLPKNTTLYWRVQTKPAKGSQGPSGWSQVRFLTMPVNPPPAISLLLPKNNTLATDYTPTFAWTPVVLPTGMNFQNYIIQVDDDPQFGSPELDYASITDQFTTQFEPGSDFDPNIKYYWRVRAVNTDGELSNWSRVFYFRMAILPPTLLTPANGNIVGSLEPTLDWDDVAGASGYVIQVSLSPTFEKKIVSANTVTSMYTLLGGNWPPNTGMYWRVQAKPAKGSYGPSAWGSTFYFTIP